MPDKLSSMAGTRRASCGRMCSGPAFCTILAMVVRLSACTSFTELPTPAFMKISFKRVTGPYTIFSISCVRCDSVGPNKSEDMCVYSKT